MSEITRSEAYVELYTWNSDIRSRIQAISTGDFATPKAVYALSVSDEALADMAGLQDLSVFSEDLQTFLTQRMLSAMLLLRSDFVPSSSEEASPSAERGTTESKIDRSDWLGCEDAPTEREDSVSSYLYFRCGSV